MSLENLLKLKDKQLDESRKQILLLEKVKRDYEKDAETNATESNNMEKVNKYFYVDFFGYNLDIY